MKAVITFFSIVSLGVAYAKGQTPSKNVVSDPIADMTSWSAIAQGDQVLEIKVDINHDGIPDVIVCLSQSDADNETPPPSYLWSLYIGQKQGGYVLAGEKALDGTVRQYGILGMRSDAYFFGYIKEIKGYGLLTLDQGMAAKGKGPQFQLNAITINTTDNTFTVTPIGKKVYDYQSFPLIQRFKHAQYPAIQTLPVPGQ